MSKLLQAVMVFAVGLAVISGLKDLRNRPKLERIETNEVGIDGQPRVVFRLKAGETK